MVLDVWYYMDVGNKNTQHRRREMKYTVKLEDRNGKTVESKSFDASTVGEAKSKAKKEFSGVDGWVKTLEGPKRKWATIHNTSIKWMVA